MTLELVHVDGARLRVARSGAGRPVLLLPGGGGCSDYLGPVAARIEDHGTVHRVEPRGCGGSDHDGRYDLATTLADLEAVRVHAGVERWVVGGHSHGAFYALAYALRYPTRACGVLYLAGSGLQSDRSWSAAYHAGLEAGHDREVPEGTYTFNPAVNAVANAEFKAYVRRAELWRDVARLTVPVRAVHGENDIRPRWPVEQLVSLLPQARLDVIAGAPHDFWFTHPDELAVLLRRYLTELPP